MYRAGIIGCGFIGVSAPDSHMKAYQDCPEISGVALCDSKSDHHPYLGFLYTDYMKMIKDMSPDIVSVCTPPETHCQIVCDIAPYVKAIYCEKPIATTLAEADKMIEVCHQNNVILQVNHQRLFMRPKFRFSRGYINTGTHLFSLINHLFKEGIEIETEYLATDEPIFELDCTHNKEPMLLKGVEHLVKCLKLGEQSISSGEAAREALADCLEYIKENTTIVKVGKKKWLKVTPFRL